MGAESAPLPPLQFFPLTPDRWGELEALFGPRGACGGCWCMVWRLARADFDRGKGEANRRAFAALVAAGEEPGVLAYAAGTPVGWCAVAPRERYPALARSRILARVDEAPVWSVSCFFVARGWRRQGVAKALLGAAVAHAAARGATVVEGYPIEPTVAGVPDPFAWIGPAAAFRSAGFVEVARRSARRPIMRRPVGGG